MKRRSLQNQKGFTLIEIAIVLVIIGILTVGILQGQEMIENSKVKSVVADMKAVGVAYNGYVDRYQAVPGDETAATMTTRGFAGTEGTATAANGLIAIAHAVAFLPATGTESTGFWRALRGAGLLSGDAAAAAGTATLPRHRADGFVGVTSVAPFGLTGKVFVCASGLTAKQAGAIDVAIDGPLPATLIGANVGNLRAVAGAAGTNVAPAVAASATAYDETNTQSWTVCMRSA